MDFYTMKIAGLERNLPICEVNEHLDIAGFVIFGDAELTVACAKELIAKCPEFDFIVAPEAKSIPYIDSLEGEQLRGKRVLILDDVISTGESLKASEELVKMFDGKIVGEAAILAEGDAADRDDIIYLERLPLFFK